MSQVSTDLRQTRERARELRFEPTGGITQTNVQKAIEQVGTQPQSISSTAINFAASPYTVLTTDSYLYVDSSAGPVQILLQAAAARSGVPLVVKDVGGQAGVNNITLTPSAGETIDLLASVVIDGPYGGYRLNPRSGTGYTLGP